MPQPKNTSRRNFIKSTTLASVAALTVPQIVSAALSTENAGKKIKLNTDDVILFQGDSITDSGRKKDVSEVNNTSAMGSGYAMIAGSSLLYDHAGKNLQIYNRGISGNKVYQLAERWEKDCLDLQPNVLSILIGVNDFWHMINGKYEGTLSKYKDDFSALLQTTKQKLPGINLVIGEPFAVIGVKSVNEKWYPAFNDYRAAAKEIAKSFDAVFIPYQNVFETAQKQAPGVYWTADGVHPTLAGCQLMARAWLQNVK